MGTQHPQSPWWIFLSLNNPLNLHKELRTLQHAANQTYVQTALEEKKKCGGAYLLQVTLVTLVLVELVHFGVYAILFDLLVNSVILFGARKDLHHADSADEKQQWSWILDADNQERILDTTGGIKEAKFP